MKNTIIVDNAPYAFASQIDNGYPIIPFYDCKEDEEITKLENYLLQIANKDDLRVENRNKFKLKELSDLKIGKYIQYYSKTDSGPELNPGNSAEGITPINSKISTELQNYKSDLDNMFEGKKH